MLTFDYLRQTWLESMNKKILIVDDSGAFSRLLTHILQKKYDCTVARNGVEAFALMRTWNIPDLIICDVNMPEMNGEVFLNALQNSGMYSCLPVIVMTGDEAHTDVFQNDLQTRFLTKPFQPNELLEKIEELFQAVNVAEA